MNHVDVTVPRVSSGIFHDPLPGTGYRAVRRMGGGSTSEVYEAIGPDHARCAVKVLRSVYVHDAEAVFRFQQEARTLSSLDHPSLVRVLDAGTTAAWRPFLVMPFFKGETARARLCRRGPFAPRVACAIFADLLDDLDAAHRGGVVHRDVKPANISLPVPTLGAATPRAVLLDFGVAKVLGAEGRQTTGSAVVGTPRYLAPEQILGGAVDARTDVYAAGLTLFELIAGRGPFDDAGGSIDVMRAHVETAPPSLADLAPVSPELAHVVARAIAKSPSRRWPSARAFAVVAARAAVRERIGFVVAEERAS